MKKSAFSTAAIMTFLLTLIAVDNAYAVPSFARQTGLDCMACHTAFPELTQMGRDFKLRGYTMGGGETKMPLPLAAMVMADATNIAKSKNNWLCLIFDFQIDLFTSRHLKFFQLFN